MRVALKRDRIQSSDREHHAEVEEPLRFGGAEKEVAFQQRADQRGVIVREHFRASLAVVVQVLDDERIVEIDDHRQRLHVREQVVRHMSLHDGDVRIARAAMDVLRREPLIGREYLDAVSRKVQDVRHFEEADADAGRLPVPERLRTDQQHAAHPFPRSFSITACSFHVCDL